MSPATSLSRGVANALLGHPGVIERVPENNILDNAVEDLSPMIRIGETQTVDSSLTLSRDYVTVYLDLHVFVRETGKIGSQIIMGEIRKAIKAGVQIDTHKLVDLRITSERCFRHTDSSFSHGIVTIEALIGEVLA